MRSPARSWPRSASARAGCCERKDRSSAPADELEHRLGGALARFPGAGDGAPERLVRRLAGEEDAAAERLGEDLARGLAAGRRGGGGAEHPRLVVPARGMAALHLILHVGAVERA